MVTLVCAIRTKASPGGAADRSAAPTQVVEQGGGDLVGRRDVRQVRRAFDNDLPRAADTGRDGRAVLRRRRRIVGTGDHQRWRLARAQVVAEVHVGNGQAAARIAGGVGALELGNERIDYLRRAIGERGGETPAGPV